MTRKELIDAYKNTKSKIGVFQIRNTANNKIFVEGSINLDSIWNRHRTQLNFGSHESPSLQKDWNEIGEENFIFEVLSEIKIDETNPFYDARKEVATLEAMYKEELQPFGEKGYNKSK
jgi:hypothetical protein